MKRIKKGLDLPLSGAATKTIDVLKKPLTLGIIGDDYKGLKPSMLVQIGDSVKIGQPLVAEKSLEGVTLNSPANGIVKAINRGARRVLQSIVISNEGDDEISYEHHHDKSAKSYSRQEVISLLCESGEWTSLRVRPYEKFADPKSTPNSIFITAIDTNPLAADINTIMEEESNKEYFNEGIIALTKLTDGKTYLCSGKDFSFMPEDIKDLVHETFEGPHPAGNVGTHIHMLDAVNAKKQVWHIGFQEVIAIGALIKKGKLHTDRYISLAGPRVRDPKIYKVRKGTEISSLVDDLIYDFNDSRVISGSVFNGRTVDNNFNFLGRFHYQITVLKEGNQREFLGWHMPGLNKFSIKNVFLAKVFGSSKKYDMTTNLNGCHRALLPIGSFEKVMPLDIQPTFLLRALLAGDTDKAQKLGALELAEEDLSLCTFVDPGKKEFGPILRDILTTIEKDG